MQNHKVLSFLVAGCLLCAAPTMAAEGKVYEADICVYGGTVSGVAAGHGGAIQTDHGLSTAVDAPGQAQGPD
jgi:hypothetical protein